jgi:hypothetical protein
MVDTCGGMAHPTVTHSGWARPKFRIAFRLRYRTGVLHAGAAPPPLIIPRVDLEGTTGAAIAPAAVRRAVQQTDLVLQAPAKNTANVLQSIGLNDNEKLQVTRQPASAKGCFTRLNALGMTAAFFGEEKDEDDAKTELADQYDFYPNFPLSIPARVRMDDVPATRGRAALAAAAGRGSQLFPPYGSPTSRP